MGNDQPNQNSALDKWLPTIIVAIITVIGSITVALINRSTTITTVFKPIEFTQTAAAFQTAIAEATSAVSTRPTDTPAVDSTTQSPTETFTATPEDTQIPPVATVDLLCTENLISQPWRLEATADAAEAWIDFSDQSILQGRDILRITYNLHGLMAQEGRELNDSTIVFTQPNWYGASLANYGQNGLDGEQTVDIPLSQFLELPNFIEAMPGGSPLNLDELVSSLRVRFWSQNHFIVDITRISLCTLP